MTDTGIHVIGLGVAEFVHLIPQAEWALGGAEIVIGSERQLETVRRITGKSFSVEEEIILPPLNELAALLDSHSDKNVAILASGDPLYYGIGRWLAKRYSSDRLRFYPGISSIQAACHSIGLSLQDATVVSLHGRPLATLNRHLALHQSIVILTDKHSTPQHLAHACQQAGFTESTLWVCEKLGYQEQQVRRFAVNDLLVKADDDSVAGASKRSLSFDPLHVTIIKVQGRSSHLPRFPGIADTDFITDGDAGKGLLTKREVRLAILSLLQAAPSDVIWDIGAGCGGVAVELALWNPLGQIHAIEHHDARLTCLEQNRQRFGVVDNLQITAGRAPDVLSTLPAANKVFIGGSDGELSGMLDRLWENLPAHGVIVASAVMENTRGCLLQFAQRLRRDGSGEQGASQLFGEVETLQIAVSRGGELAGQLVYRPALPVTLFKFTKSNTNHSNGT